MTGLLYRFIVKTNVFIALCACCFYTTGWILAGNKVVDIERELLLVIFTSTYFIYSISQKPIKWLPIAQYKFSIERWFLVVAILVIIYYSLNIATEVIVVLLILGLVSVLYNAISLKESFLLPLRSIPLLKVFLISIVWGGVGVILPIITAVEIDWEKTYLLLFSQILFILSITLPFDIRDFYKDFKNDLITVPSVIGIMRTKYLAYLFLVLHVIGMSILNPFILIIYLPFAILTFILINGATASKPNYYYTFFIDGVIILQFVLLYVLSIWS